MPNLFISDGDNVDLFNGTSLNTSFITSMDQASGLAFGPNGTLYAASLDDAQVYSFNPTTGGTPGTPFVTFFGSNDPRSVQGPDGMIWGPDGNLYIADVTASNVHLFSNTGASVASIGGTILGQPVNVAFNHSGQLFAVDNNGVEQYNGSEFVSYIPSVSAFGSYTLNVPGAVAFSSAGDAYVLDNSGASAAILKFTGTTYDGQIVDLNADNFAPSDMIVGPDGKLYVSGIDDNTSEGEVLDFNLDGTGESVYVSGLNNPTYMAFAAPEPSASLLAFAGLGLVGLCRSRRRAT
ncbi:MAG TPA: PEP-CTERM sorting domain-containing protein [Chthoniobacter sp.]